MSSPKRVLKQSFSMLIERPKLFVPKLLSTTFASIFIVYLISGRQNFSTVSLPVLIGSLVLSLLGISILGVFSSMMLSSMVKNGSRSLEKGFLDVCGRISNVIVASVIILLTAFSVSMILSIGYLVFSLTGNYFMFAVSLIVFISLILGLSYASYFLPITLLENGFRGAIRNSYTTSKENRRVVLSLLIFSFALISVAFVSTGFLETLGYFGFIAGRIISSVVNTYIFVVSPNYYLDSVGGE